MAISNPLERQIADALDSRGIKWLHEDEKGNAARLDFYLPDYCIYVEVKQAYTPRTDGQLERAKNVIMIQGIEAVYVFVKLICP